MQSAEPKIIRCDRWKEFIKRYEQILDIKDRQAVGIVIATYATLGTQGDPPWLLWIAPPASGKTETLRGFKDHKNCMLITDFTEKALVSHYQKDKYDTEDYSLIKKMLNKVNVILDISPILAFHPSARAKIFSTLRAAYDGDTDFFSGIGSRAYVGKFVLIAAATPIIEKYRAMESSLGERFLSLRTAMPKSERKNAARRSIDNSSQKEDMRGELRKMIHDLVGGIELDVNVSEEEKDYIADAADFLGYGRSSVERDKYHRNEVTAEPIIELGARTGDQLLQIYTACIGLMGRDEARLAINRVIRDSLPVLRSKILGTVARHEEVKVSDFSHLKVHPNTVRYCLEDLALVEILETSNVRHANKTEDVYSARGEFKDIIKNLYLQGR